MHLFGADVIYRRIGRIGCGPSPLSQRHGVRQVQSGTGGIAALYGKRRTARLEPEIEMTSEPSPYPVSYAIERPERYNRWTVGFRFALLIPLLLVLGVGNRRGGFDAANGISGLLVLLAVYAWFTILFTGRFPTSMRNTEIFIFRWSQKIGAYLFLLADPYPPFGDGEYPLRLGIAPAEQYDRWSVAFRLILAIPHFVILFFLGLAVVLVTLIAWFAILFTGQYPESWYQFSVGVARWSARVTAYVYLLVDTYPPFELWEPAPTMS